MQLETERLLIRSLQTNDVSALAQLWADPDVVQFMGGPRDYDLVYQSLVEDAGADPPKFDLWPVLEKASRQIVGHCGLLDKEVDGQLEYELVYVPAKNAWGQGYATEAARALKDCAFNRLGLTRIISLVDPDNVGSERVAKKAGLRYEKDTVRPGGKIMRVYSAR